MADFVAVLKKTLDGLGETTPEMRARVYDKARSTIAAKLAALNPPPPAAVGERQRRALEDAIASIEKEYNRKAPGSDPLAELENIFTSIDRNKNQPTHSRPAVKADPAAWQKVPPPPIPAPKLEQPAWLKTTPPPDPAPKTEPAWDKSLSPTPDDDDDEGARLAGEEPAEIDEEDDIFSDENDKPRVAAAPQTMRPERHRRGYGRPIAAVVALLVVAGGGYGIWLNQETFRTMLGMGGSGEPVKTRPVAEAAPAKPAKPAKEVASAQPAPPPAVAPAPAEPAETPKFTQRLTPEGKEVDPGPAGGGSGVGEGTSVAALTTPPVASSQPPAPAAATPPADAAAAPDKSAAGQTPAEAGPAGQTPGASLPAPSDSAAPAAPSTETAAATSPAAVDQPLAVSQKAIFYEERTSAAPGSAEPGTIVWSLVQESPGNDLPPEPAIRAEATIPGKDVQLRMTIRRNADKTLPASHIIEMIFLTPDGFEGGGIDNILRVAMKTSEQDAGSPLIGIPAKIADGFFLVALNDTKADEDANLTLLRGQDWIDVPVVYKSGRRALLTMEKGIPGEKVFDEALKAWQAKTSG